MLVRRWGFILYAGFRHYFLLPVAEWKMDCRYNSESWEVLYFIFKKFIYVFRCLPVCLSVHCMHAWCPKSPEENSGSPGPRL